MAKLLRYQLIAFILVTALGVTYTMISYLGLIQALGFGQYHVSVNMPAVGGLYTNAVVTERGVTVGKVDGIRLVPGGRGAVADIALNNGTRIPSDLHAAVGSTSAVGEQYLELTPQASGGPYLAAGSVIPARDVSLPPDPTVMLKDVNALLQSVPTQQLNTTVNELYKAFNGTGPDLGRLLDSSGQLITAARQNLSPTQKLIGQSQAVLGTQAADSASIRDFSRNLNLFTTQLRKSNADLADTLNQAPGTVTQMDRLVGQLQPTVPLLLGNLTSLGQVLRVYLPNIRATLVILPADIDDVSSIFQEGQPGIYDAEFFTELNNPGTCQSGYSSAIRQPSDIGYKAAPRLTPYCTAPHNSPLDVRAGRNDPCPNNPSLRAITAAGCGLHFGVTGAPGESYGGDTYDPGNGLFVGPDGLLYSVGPRTLNGAGPATLQGLLKQTLGN